MTEIYHAIITRKCYRVIGNIAALCQAAGIIAQRPKCASGANVKYRNRNLSQMIVEGNIYFVADAQP